MASAGVIAPAGATAAIAAATIAAATTPDFADGNLGPESTDSALKGSMWSQGSLRGSEVKGLSAGLVVAP